MKLAFALFVFVLSACSTKVFGPDGKPQLITPANVTRLRFKGPGTSLEMDGVDHSTPTKAGFGGVTNVITAAGAAAAGGLR